MKRMRIFVSSTFQDMQEERDLLVNTTFQSLRYEAARLGIHLEVIDLRWGIPDGGNEALIVNACLQLADSCKPHLLAIIGGRSGWRPSYPGDKSVTEMELERFLEEGLVTPQSALALFKDVSGDSDVRSLRDRLSGSGRVRICKYQRPNEISGVVHSHFSEELRRLADLDDEQDRTRAYRTLLSTGSDSIFGELADLVSEALGSDRTVVLESSDGLARSYLLDEVVCLLRAKSQRVIYVDMAAEAIASSGVLCSTLQDMELVAPRGGALPPEIAKTTLVIDGWESLVDFPSVASGQVDTLALSGVLRQLQVSCEAGLSLVLAGDFTARPQIREFWPDGKYFQVNVGRPQITTVIHGYLRAAGKSLTSAQLETAVSLSMEQRLSLVRVLLSCDRLRRNGALKRDGQTQDSHVDMMVRQCFANQDDGDVTGAFFKDMQFVFGEAIGDGSRLATALDSLALISGTKLGVSFNDLAELGLQPFDWGVLRALAGGTLVGDVDRVRVSREDLRDHFISVLGCARVERITDAYLERKLAQIRSATSVTTWIEARLSTSSEFLWQPRLWDSGGTVFALLDARVWPAICALDPNLLGTRVLEECLTQKRIEQMAAGLHRVMEPDQQILGLTQLVIASEGMSDKDVAMLARVFEHADRALNLSEAPEGTTFIVQQRVAAYAIQRARVALLFGRNQRQAPLALAAAAAIDFLEIAYTPSAIEIPGLAAAVKLARIDIVQWVLRLAGIGPIRYYFARNFQRAASYYEPPIGDYFKRLGVEHGCPDNHVTIEPEFVEAMIEWLASHSVT